MDERMGPFLDQLSLDELKLQGNKLHCNCENTWFRRWLEDRGVTGVKCASPARHAGIDLRALSAQDMSCLPPNVTGITGSTDYGAEMQGSGAVLEVNNSLSTSVALSDGTQIYSFSE